MKISGSILWKILLVLAVAVWAGSCLFPLQDTPFEDYIVTRATKNQDEYKKLLETAKTTIAAGKASTLFQAIPMLATEQKVDLNATYFPDVKLIYISNLKERNREMIRLLRKHSQSKLKLGLDLSGGIAFTLKIGNEALIDKNTDQRQAQLAQVVKIMNDRMNASGLSEPLIRPIGEDSIEIQIAGENARNNPDLVNSLKKPARLEFRQVHRTLSPDTTPMSEWPVGYEAMIYSNTDSRTGEVSETKMFIQKLPMATGKIISRSYPQLAPSATEVYWVGMSFTEEGRNTFANMTRRIAEENQSTGSVGSMAVVLDGKVESVASVREEIRGDAVIQGTFTYKESLDLSNVLNNPLEVPLEISEIYEVGPTLAKDARTSSIFASVVGACLVVLFMLIYYRAGGLISIITLIVNVFMIIGVLAAWGATITLPGVAALVLTIGMAVDANILNYERIREELRSGKSVESAVELGFSKAFSTIIDANVTTLITAIILAVLGSGPVKGFGITLGIGIVTTVFTSLILTRGLLELLLSLGIKNILKPAGKPYSMDFMNYRKTAFISSWSVVAVGLIVLLALGKGAYGIDFTGGEEVSISYAKELELKEITRVADKEKLGEIIPGYQNVLGQATNSVLKIQTEFDKGEALFKALNKAHPDAKLELIGVNKIGATVSDSITLNALLSVVGALICILIYVAIRFEFGYGVGAVVATVHDVLITIGLFIICGQLGIGSGQFTAPMVAAILMIIGYSINDTVVVFDRIREELDMNPALSLFKVVNLAISCTLSRTILTGLTTLLAATGLFIFGVGVVTDYALVFIIGVLVGTFSSIFIASPVFYWWHKGDRRHVVEGEFVPKYDWETGSK